MKEYGENELNTKEKIKDWIVDNLDEGKMYGPYQCYISGWMHLREVIEYRFDQKQRELCSDVLTELLCDIRNNDISWREKKIDRLLLVAHDFDDPSSSVPTEIRKIAEEGGFGSLSLQKRLFQSLLSVDEYMSPDYWLKFFEKDPEVFSGYVFAGLSHFNLRSSFEILNELDLEDEIDFERKLEMKLYHEIRGLLSSDDYERDEIIEEAKRSKEYLTSTAYCRVKRALPEMDE